MALSMLAGSIGTSEVAFGEPVGAATDVVVSPVAESESSDVHDAAATSRPPTQASATARRVRRDIRRCSVRWSWPGGL